MPLAEVKVFLNYGGKGGKKRSFAVTCFVPNDPAKADYDVAATTLANAVAPMIVDQARVTQIKVTQLAATDNETLPEPHYQSIFLDVVGTKAQGANKDAANADIVGMFRGRAKGGRAPIFNIPFFTTEEIAQSDKNLDPEAVGLVVATQNVAATTLYNAFNDGFGPPCIPGLGADRNASKRNMTGIIWFKLGRRSLPNGRKGGQKKLLEATRSLMLEMNADVKREEKRVRGTAEKFDPDLLTEIKDRFTKLIADTSPSQVRKAKVPKPLANYVAVPA